MGSLGRKALRCILHDSKAKPLQRQHCEHERCRSSSTFRQGSVQSQRGVDQPARVPAERRGRSDCLAKQRQKMIGDGESGFRASESLTHVDNVDLVRSAVTREYLWFGTTVAAGNTVCRNCRSPLSLKQGPEAEVVCDYDFAVLLVSRRKVSTP